MKLYKGLNVDGTPCHGGAERWNLQGEWMPLISDIALCERGYHLCRRADLVLWLGPAIWEVEHRGQMIEAWDKVVVGAARLVKRMETWNERTARLFACDCAERVLPLYEAEYPSDIRPRDAIRIARLYAEGERTEQERAASRAAASDEAGNAAWDAAQAAAQAAAGAAARAIAWNEAGNEAWDAAQAAAQAAARAAARAAAWAVGGTAWAVKGTAWASGGTGWAIGGTALATERAWQTTRLFEYLETQTTERRRA